MKRTLGFLMIMVSAELVSGIALAAAPDWLVYKNATYGFTIQYPKNLRIEKKFDHYYHLPANWRFPIDDNPIGKGVAVVNIPVFRTQNNDFNPNYYSAEVRVGVSNDPVAVKNCIAGSQQTKVINGITFALFPIDSEGMSQYLNGVSYRTVHNKQCYAVEQFQTGSKPINDPSPKDIPQEKLTQYYNQTSAIIQTFTFTR